MKKFFIVILSLLMILNCAVFTNAALHNKDSRYTIDLPEGFNEVGDNKFIGSDGSTFSVSFDDNTKERFCIAEMDEKDIQEFVDEMESVLNSFSSGLTVEAVSNKKIEHTNGQNAIVIVFEQSYVEDGENKSEYQRLYMFSGKENVATFTYTTADKAKLNSMDKAFDSIIVSEDEFTPTDKIISVVKTVALYAAITIIMLVGIILFVKRRNR